MGRNIDEVIAALPKERRSRINSAARQMAGEMVAHADSLTAVRKAFKKTQVEIGEKLGLPQNAVSQLEKREDMLLSTLVRYVGALGGELKFVIQLKDGSEVVLEGVGEPSERSATPKASSSRKKVRDRATALSRR